MTTYGLKLGHQALGLRGTNHAPVSRIESLPVNLVDSFSIKSAGCYLMTSSKHVYPSTGIHLISGMESLNWCGEAFLSKSFKCFIVYSVKQFYNACH